MTPRTPFADEATAPEPTTARDATIPERDLGIDTPTDFAPPRLPPPPPAGPALRVISMKDAERARGSEDHVTPRKHKVELRTLSEVSRRHATPPSGLGFLAPPRDAREARTRRWRDNVVWGCAIVILGCAVMIGVWFLGRG